jgi:F420-dependent oxidoreductase-like protein
MKLGLSIGYSKAQLDLPVALVQRADELGYDTVWTAEAYGTDAVSPLAYLAAVTKRIKLGTAVMQLAARSPANAAMCAGTVDALAGGGRFIAGLGVSGPQIVEGWYGQPWGKPYYRVKDYAAIMRKIWKREAPLTHEGTEISLPYTGEGALGVGKPLKSILHMNPDIPIYLGTETDAMVRLTGEIADGWLALGFVPGSLAHHMPMLEEGFRRAEKATGKQKTRADFTIQASCHVIVDDDVKAALARLKPEVALYVGGMGHKDKNFHKDMMIRRGFGDAAARIQELYLAGRKEEANAAVPDEWVDMKSLVGPPARIKERFRTWEDSGADALTVRSRQPQAIEVMAEAARLNAGGSAA